MIGLPRTFPNVRLAAVCILCGDPSGSPLVLSKAYIIPTHVRKNLVESTPVYGALILELLPDPALLSSSRTRLRILTLPYATLPPRPDMVLVALGLVLLRTSLLVLRLAVFIPEGDCVLCYSSLLKQ